MLYGLRVTNSRAYELWTLRIISATGYTIIMGWGYKS